MAPKPDPHALHAERLGAFIVRARRVEEHSLARDKALVVEIAEVTIKLLFGPDGAKMRTILPESEEQLESATARVRPLVLSGEPSKGLNAVTALGYLLRGRPEFDDGPVGQTIRELRDGWKRLEPGAPPHENPYHVHIGDAGSNESNTWWELGWAWVYGDVVHSDAEKRTATRLAGVEERYRAGAILVCQIIIQAISTLNVIRGLRKAGLLDLPDEPFEEQVVVTPEKLAKEVEVWTAAHDEEGGAPSLPPSPDVPLGPEFEQWTFDRLRRPGPAAGVSD